MRTLRTAFTCLCLLASLSFACEIPLILEETIQLPDSTPYWDVMPHFFGYYYWMTAGGRSDSTTLIKWGSTESSDEDSFFVNTGHPSRIYGFFTTDYSPCAIISGSRTINIIGWPGYYTQGKVIIFDLTTHSHVCDAHNWPSEAGGHTYSYWTNSSYRLSSVEGSPSPPMMSNRIPCIRTHYYSQTDLVHNEGNYTDSYIVSTYIHNLLNTTEYYEATMLPGLASFTQWADSTIVGIIGAKQRTYSGATGHWVNYTHRMSLYSLTDDSLHQLSSYYLTELSDENNPGVAVSVVIYDFINSNPVLVAKIGSRGIEARTNESEESIWSIENTYRYLASAYVLIGDYSEQVLAYDEDRQLFDIIKIEDGSIWGQTSELPNNYNEMKIIGRYHNDYRRLAVRYGDEIRIFAFGDPITEDADDTPTIPQSYLFTAYPNPFNPSTTLEFSLPVYEDVRLSVFNTLGQEVAVLTDKQHSPGKYSYTFDASVLPSGIYFARMATDRSQVTKKLVLLK